MQEDYKHQCVMLIKQGEWVVPLFLPMFRRQLAADLHIDNHDLCSTPSAAITLLRYRKTKPLSVFCKSEPNTFAFVTTNCPDAAFWQDALRGIHSSGVLGKMPQDSFLATFQEALQLIKAQDFKTHSIFQMVVDFVCLVDEADYRSASHPHFYGVLFLAKQSRAQDLAVSIVHELAHQELFLINLIDRLVMESSDYSLAHAPYQQKKRPPIGRLHSAHALFRMVGFEKKIGYEKALRHEQLLRQTINSFQDGELTDYAKSLVKNY